MGQWQSDAGERLVERLEALLNAHPAANGAEVIGWRFEIGESSSIQAGVKDSHLGGPYHPPSLATAIGGGIVLVWSDGLHTYSTVDALAVEEFDERLHAWRLSAFVDPDAPPLLPPADYPAVETSDPRVEEIVDGESQMLFDLLRRALETCRAHGATFVDAGVGASRGVRHLRSSTGIRVRFPETWFSFWVSADDLYSRGFAKRRVLSAEEVEFVMLDVAETAAALRSDAQPVSGTLPVVLPPGASESFYGQYLSANLSGAAVVNGHSAFTLEDFHAGRQVARADLRVWVDTLLPLEGAASPVSPEGVPGGQADLIREGKLVTPVLDLKYARRAQFPPTPLPRGGPGMLLQAERDNLQGDDLVRRIERGLYVYGVLGMHTQDSTSGQYSLVAPQARVIEDGRLLPGKTKVVLAGNFFEHLRDERTLFARFPHEWIPGLLVHCQVSSQR